MFWLVSVVILVVVVGVVDVGVDVVGMIVFCCRCCFHGCVCRC